jgi:regulatory protein
VKISRLEYRPRVDRVRLYVDEEEAPRLEIAIDLLLRSGLATGDPITLARLAALELEDQTYRAREAALSLLAHRARARAELRRRLRRKDFADDVIDETLAWLDERGYIDDRAFAESFVRDRLNLRPRGRLGLIQELRKKGVDDAVAEAAIDQVMDRQDIDETALATTAAEAWARKNGAALEKAAASREGRLKARRRLYGHLARRGFAGEAIGAALSAVLAE